jgi:hypothetical protein
LIPEREIGKVNWASADWTEFDPDACAIIPNNAPKPMGLLVQLNVFVDAAYATNLLRRRLVTGIIIFFEWARRWYLKRQNTIESSMFCSEFVAMKIATEMVEGICYKLQMMGIQLDGPANIFGGNESDVKNKTRP